MTTTTTAERKLFVVVVTYNGEPWIRRCLSSLLPAAAGTHVIVVDNASTDGTCNIVDSEFPAVQLLRSQRNLGFGRGNNLGIREALASGANYVFLLNQDAYVMPSTITDLVQFMNAHPEVGAASPLHCSPDADHIDCMTLRGYLQTLVPAYLADACMGHIAPYYRTHGVNAAAWFVRAEVFERCGGFDPLFFMYGEDDDLLARWAYHGIAFTLLTGCKVVHLRQSAQATRPTIWQDIRRRAERRRSELTGLIKHPGFSLPHVLLVGLAEGWVLPLGDFLIRRQWRDYIASAFAALRVLFELPRICRHIRLTGRQGRHFL